MKKDIAKERLKAEKQRIRSARLKAKRRFNNQCTICGKPLDRDGALCSSCLSRQKQYNRESYEYYISVGICPICKKNELFGNEKSCLECRAKRSAYDRKRTKEKVERNKKTYNDRIEKGLCPRCGKEKEDDGFSWCQECREKRGKWIARKGKKNVKAEWSSQGLCSNCGSDDIVPGKKLCQSCYRASLAGLKKAIANRPEGYNDTWKKTNMRMRGRFRRLPTQ